jgi:hypothetical protein
MQDILRSAHHSHVHHIIRTQGQPATWATHAGSIHPPKLPLSKHQDPCSCRHQQGCHNRTTNCSLPAFCLNVMLVRCFQCYVPWSWHVSAGNYGTLQGYLGYLGYPDVSNSVDLGELLEGLLLVLS